MNPYFRRLLGSLLLAAGLTVSLVGQTDAPTPPTPPPAAEKAVEAPSSPSVAAAAEPAPSAAAPIATETATAAPSAAEPAPAAPDTAATSTASEPALRRLDTEPSADSTQVETAPATTPAKGGARKSRRGSSDLGGPRVMILNDVHVGPGERAEVAVAVGGNATNEGEVHGPVVAIGGDARSTGNAGEAVVAVLGNSYVNGETSEVVAVMGNVELGPKAVVRGQIVCIGGSVKRHPDAVNHGEVVQVGLPLMRDHAEWLQTYVRKCILMARPLAIGPNLGWAWFIAFGFLAVYAFLGLIFNRSVRRTQETLETRPGGSFLAAILTILLAPVLTVLLAITVIGVAAIPFIVAALVVAKFFGKIVILAWLGSRITRLLTQGRTLNAGIDVIVGGLIVLGLYCIPVVGFLTFKLIGMLGLGVAVYTVILATKKSKPATPPKVAYVPVAGAPVSSPPSAGFTSPTSVPAMGAGFAATAGTIPATDPSATIPAGAEIPAGFAAMPPPVAPPFASTALPRAGFWIRMGALAIDTILVAVVMGISTSVLPRFLHVHPPGLLLALAIYGAIFWKLRGTTIGGIICGLRVVRTDGRELDWSTAVVRALGCFLSLIVVGLGFIWVAIDDEKQSWHDKIAGTTVVLSRGSNPLV